MYEFKDLRLVDDGEDGESGLASPFACDRSGEDERLVLSSETEAVETVTGGGGGSGSVTVATLRRLVVVVLGVVLAVHGVMDNVGESRHGRIGTSDDEEGLRLIIFWEYGQGMEVVIR